MDNHKLTRTRNRKGFNCNNRSPGNTFISLTGPRNLKALIYGINGSPINAGPSYLESFPGEAFVVQRLIVGANVDRFPTMERFLAFDNEEWTDRVIEAVGTWVQK